MFINNNPLLRRRSKLPIPLSSDINTYWNNAQRIIETDCYEVGMSFLENSVEETVINKGVVKKEGVVKENEEKETDCNNDDDGGNDNNDNNNSGNNTINDNNSINDNNAGVNNSVNNTINDNNSINHNDSVNISINNTINDNNNNNSINNINSINNNTFTITLPQINSAADDTLRLAAADTYSRVSANAQPNTFRPLVILPGLESALLTLRLNAYIEDSNRYIGYVIAGKVEIRENGEHKIVGRDGVWRGEWCGCGV